MTQRRFFRQCLIHTMNGPDGQRHEYVLPYAFDLDDDNYKDLADRLRTATGFSKYYRKEFIERLKSDLLTQSLENVTLGQDEEGFWQISGKTWARFGLPDGHFVVLASIPCYSDCGP